MNTEQEIAQSSIIASFIVTYRHLILGPSIVFSIATKFFHFKHMNQIKTVAKLNSIASFAFVW